FFIRIRDVGLPGWAGDLVTVLRAPCLDRLVCRPNSVVRTLVRGHSKRPSRKGSGLHLVVTGEWGRCRPADLDVHSIRVHRRSGSAFLYLSVSDTDATYQRAIDLGAESLEAPLDTPYGDRRGMVRDPYGNIWQIATRQSGG